MSIIQLGINMMYSQIILLQYVVYYHMNHIQHLLQRFNNEDMKSDV